MTKTSPTLFILVLILFGLKLSVANAQEKQTIELASKHNLFSKTLNENREYWLRLPQEYQLKNVASKNYPVLIVLDANAHFKTIATMVESMSRSGKIPEMIVIGIQNVDRRRDFTPDKVITVRENNTGGGENFLQFLEEELLANIQQQYRTSGYFILFGHSLGGLITTHTYMKENTLFKAFIAADPSFGTWDATEMDKKLANLKPISFERYLYISTANWGKRNFKNRDRHLRFYEALNQKCEKEFPATLRYFESENHQTVPIPSFYYGISAIYEGYGISYRDVDSIAQLNHHFETISQRLSWKVNPPESLINRIGYRFLRSQHKIEKEKAVDFFKLNTQLYPNSSNSFNSLAEAYLATNNTSLAIENYKKAVALNPDNTDSKQQLQKLMNNQ